MRFITADSIFDGEVFLSGDHAVVLEGEKILDILPASEINAQVLERLNGILTPGFVNAHCHLELSHLINCVPRRTGLSGFAIELMRARKSSQPEQVQQAMQLANDFMWNNGIVLCGDISNGADSFAIKANSAIYYHTFIELIGLRPDAASAVFEKGKQLLKVLEKAGLAGSLAPHAPYTVSRELFTEIANYNTKHNTFLSVHNQESPEETDFFRGSGKNIRALYTNLGIDVAWFEPSFANSFSYFFDTIKHARSLLVHNTFTGDAELNAARLSDVWWCFCPRANQYIENALPELKHFMKQLHRTCIGTDSLASNDNLDILQEANLLLQHVSSLSTEQVLQMLTSNGAKALGQEHRFGRIQAGMAPGLNLIAEHNRNLTFVQKVI